MNESTSRIRAGVAVDEVSAAIGLARSLLPAEAVDEVAANLREVQRALFVLTAELRERTRDGLHYFFDGDAVVALDALRALWSDSAAQHPTLPSGAPGAAALRLAAATAERAGLELATVRAAQRPVHAEAYLATLAEVLRLASDRVNELGDALADPFVEPRADEDELGDAMRYAQGLLATRGSLAMRDGELWTGKRRLDGDTDVVDRVLAATGFGCTVFRGNVRVATTATAAGSETRAFGTEANEMVTRHVLGEGKTFRGITHTIGKDWKIIYAPLTVDDERVGMLAVYRELDDVLG